MEQRLQVRLTERHGIYDPVHGKTFASSSHRRSRNLRQVPRVPLAELFPVSQVPRPLPSDVGLGGVDTPWALQPSTVLRSLSRLSRLEPNLCCSYEEEKKVQDVVGDVRKIV